MLPSSLILSEESRAKEFLSPLKIHASTVFEPTNLGYNGKHNNHYTTEVTNAYDKNH
jgi:hypothetical protein